MDAMLRLGMFDKPELVYGVPRFKGMRWVTVLRELAPLADGRVVSHQASRSCGCGGST